MFRTGREIYEFAVLELISSANITLPLIICKINLISHWCVLH